MSTSTVLELSQNQAIVKEPGVYQVQLAEPLIINPGDQLSVRMVSIDSGKAAGNTIVIPQDLNLTMGFSYYEIDYHAADKYQIDTDVSRSTATFDYYAAYNDIDLVELSACSVRIVGFIPPPDNNYTKSGGSFVIGTTGPGSNIVPDHNFTITLSYLDISGSVQLITCTGTYAVGDLEWYGGNDAWGCPPPTTEYPAGTFPLIIPPDKIGTIMRKESLRVAGVSGFWSGENNNSIQKYGAFPQSGAFTTGYPKGIQYCDEVPYQVSQFEFFKVDTPDVISSTGLQLDIGTFNATLKAGRYDPASLAVRLTQLLSDANGLLPPPVPPADPDQLYVPANSFLTRTDVPRNASMVFRQLDFSAGIPNISFTTANTYSYYDLSNDITAPYFVGATEMALEYGNAGEVFSLTYAHTPMSNPGIAGEQDLAIYWNEVSGSSGGSYYQMQVVKQASGVVFHHLEPQSFWRDQLGLYDSLIVPLLTDASGINYYLKNSMLPKITYGFQGLSTFILPHTAPYPDPRKMQPIVPTLNPTYFNVTGQSRAIIGNALNLNLQGGYYLVEVLNLLRNQGGYIDNDENRVRIAAIVSTQYDSNSVITGFADSGIPYQHRGNPYLVTDAIVRILDPLKNPVKDLGQNNCVWIQIDKPAPVVEAEPVKIKPTVKRR